MSGMRALTAMKQTSPPSLYSYMEPADRLASKTTKPSTGVTRLHGPFCFTSRWQLPESCRSDAAQFCLLSFVFAMST